MDYANYQKFIKDYSDSYRLDEQTAIDTQLMGIMGESGELVECLKKETRDGKLDVDKLIGEIGDVLAYLSLVAGHNNISFSELDDDSPTHYKTWDNIDYCKHLYKAVNRLIFQPNVDDVFDLFNVLDAIAHSKGLNIDDVRDYNYRKLLKRWDEGKQRGWGDFR